MNVKHMRLRLGLSQQEFASLLCFSFVTVNRWENGRGSPKKYEGAVMELLRRSMRRHRKGNALVLSALRGARDRVEVLRALVALSEGRAVRR